MKRSKQEWWERFQKHYTEFPDLGLAIDLSRLNFADDYFASMEPRIQKAFAFMAELERGAIANPDEERMVGHYWLRNPALAPTPEIRKQIQETIKAVATFAGAVHGGQVSGEGGRFKNMLLIGIGGSALGPQFVSSALGHPANDKLRAYFLDNTDPDGMDKILANIGSELSCTLCVVISKSGKTKETRNGMLEVEEAYRNAGLQSARHFVAVTGAGSELDQYADMKGWIKRFPMWDWVGGRMSETSAVGLLPASLQGIDIQSILTGARACDIVTRQPNVKENPAAQLALAWFHACNGNGSKDMVFLPYKDRLELFSRYLQQLVMESLGKAKDLEGRVVNQGLSVYGNKGSTDQHAYMQQLRDGINNFFMIFIQILKDRQAKSILVEPSTTSGDYLNGFLLGTRQALSENSRESITITLMEVSPFGVGVLIALFERTVGLYASLININAYHQPGVEAGKVAAQAIVELQRKVLSVMNNRVPMSVCDIVSELGGGEEFENVFRICQHLAVNPDRGIEIIPAATPFDAKFRSI